MANNEQEVSALFQAAAIQHGRRIGRELDQGIKELLERHGKQGAGLMPLFDTFDPASGKLTFTNAAKEVITLDGASSQLGTAIAGLQDITDEMKESYEGKEGEEGGLEVREGADKKQAVIAGLGLKGIMELMHGTDKIAEGQELYETNPDLARAVQAHGFVKITGSAVANLKDLTKYVEAFHNAYTGGSAAHMFESVGKALEGAELAVDAVNVGMDIAELALAGTPEQQAEAGTKLAVDGVNLVWGGSMLAADMLGAEAIAAFGGALAVPLAGIGIGLTGLITQFIAQSAQAAEARKLLAHLADEAWNGFDWAKDSNTTLMPQPDIPIVNMDFVTGNYNLGAVTRAVSNEGHWNEVDQPITDVGTKNMGYLLAAAKVLVLPYGLISNYGHDDNYVYDYGPSFSDTVVNVQLGKASMALVMAPEKASALVRQPKHLGYGSLKYKLTGQGGTYSLLVDNVVLHSEGAVTLQENGDTPSTWLLRIADDLPDDVRVERVQLREGTQPVLHVGGVQILVSDSHTKVIVESKGGELTRYADHQLSFMGVNEHWVTEHRSSLYHDLDQLARNKGVTSVMVNWTAGGYARTANYTPGENKLLAAMEDGNIVAYGADGDVNLGSGYSVALSAKWFSIHHNATLNDMIVYQGYYGKPGERSFDVVGMPANVRGNTVALSGHYDDKSGQLIMADKDGAIFQFESKEARLLGVGEEWVAKHAGSLYQDLDKLASEYGASSVAVRWKGDGGYNRAASYVPGKHQLLAQVEDGNIVAYGGGADANLNDGPTVGFSPKWFVNHRGATLADMVKYSKDYGNGGDFDFDGLVSPDGKKTMGHYFAANDYAWVAAEDGSPYKVVAATNNWQSSWGDLDSGQTHDYRIAAGLDNPLPDDNPVGEPKENILAADADFFGGAHATVEQLVARATRDGQPDFIVKNLYRNGHLVTARYYSEDKQFVYRNHQGNLYKSVQGDGSSDSRISDVSSYIPDGLYKLKEWGPVWTPPPHDNPPVHHDDKPVDRHAVTVVHWTADDLGAGGTADVAIADIVAAAAKLGAKDFIVSNLHRGQQGFVVGRYYAEDKQFVYDSKDGALYSASLQGGQLDDREIGDTAPYAWDGLQKVTEIVQPQPGPSHENPPVHHVDPVLYMDGYQLEQAGILHGDQPITLSQLINYATSKGGTDFYIGGIELAGALGPRVTGRYYANDKLFVFRDVNRKTPLSALTPDGKRVAVDPALYDKDGLHKLTEMKQPLAMVAMAAMPQPADVALLTQAMSSFAREGAAGSAAGALPKSVDVLALSAQTPRLPGGPL